MLSATAPAADLSQLSALRTEYSPDCRGLRPADLTLSGGSRERTKYSLLEGPCHFVWVVAPGMLLVPLPVVTRRGSRRGVRQGAPGWNAILGE